MEKQLFTSEAVSIGHPDKVCDQISDAILDACLEQDRDSRVAVETLATTSTVVIAGEITTRANIKPDCIARDVIRQVGYEEEGFDWRTVNVQTLLHQQSTDIAQGVDASDTHQQGAGDQGMMFGYAEDNPDENYLPLPIFHAHQLMRRMERVRLENDCGIKYLRPDAKCQMTFDFTEPDHVRLSTVVLSHQHTPDMPRGVLENLLKIELVKMFPDKYLTKDTEILVNPTGRFVIGGPAADTGLTGRKIIVDTYGGMGRHGGGAFSGKDASKVDRSAAYMCRHVAKHIVKRGFCERCEIQVAYAIGIAEPVSLRVFSFNNKRIDFDLEDYVRKNFDFRPAAITEYLGLKQPDGWTYLETAQHGHFTNPEFPWEREAKI